MGIAVVMLGLLGFVLIELRSNRVRSSELDAEIAAVGEG
jgi:hypothetical protein